MNDLDSVVVPLRRSDSEHRLAQQLDAAELQSLSFELIEALGLFLRSRDAKFLVQIRQLAARAVFEATWICEAAAEEARRVRLAALNAAAIRCEGRRRKAMPK